MPEESEGYLLKGQDAFQRGKTLDALALAEKALQLEPENQAFRSFFGLCIAYERGQISRALEFCEEAVEREPERADHYLNLGRVYLRQGLNDRAISVFRSGLAVRRDCREIQSELQALGIRKKPLIPQFKRSNLLNKYLGMIFSRLGLR